VPKPELAAISALNPQLASIEYVMDALSDILIGESNGHMLIICYVNYLLSIGELDLRQIHFSKKALSGRR
jgi:hypothetical protein